MEKKLAKKLRQALARVGLANNYLVGFLTDPEVAAMTAIALEKSRTPSVDDGNGVEVLL